MCVITYEKHDSIIYKIYCSLNTIHNCRKKNIITECEIKVIACSSTLKNEIRSLKKNLILEKYFDKYDDFLNYEENICDFDVTNNVRHLIKLLSSNK